MPIYDWNGSANTEIGKIYDWNGSANTQIGKVYDNNGTTNSLIYQLQVEKQYTIYETTNHTGWWSSFGTDIGNGLFRYYAGSGEYFSPFIDFTNYTKITIQHWVSLPNGGSVALNFGVCPQSDPYNFTWAINVPLASYSAWNGPDLSGTYDISAIKGVHRIKQQTVQGPSNSITYLGDSYFTYLE